MNEYEVNEETLAAPEEEISGGEVIAVEQAVKKTGALLSPEGIIMLSAALFVDIGELLVEFIPGVGQVISIIIDIFAVIFFGFWMWFRSGAITVPKKTGERITKVTVKVTKLAKRMKWLRPLCFIIELIPVFSSFLPLWILVVYLELIYAE